MRTFKLGFECFAEIYSVTVILDYEIKATDRKNANEQKNKIDYLLHDLFSLEFDNEINDFTIIIQENEHFSSLEIKDYDIYNGDIDRELAISKIEFINKIKSNFKEPKITFIPQQSEIY